MDDLERIYNEGYRDGVRAGRDERMEVEIEGTITIDGITRNFLVDSDGARQWGATTEELGKSVDVMEAMQIAISEFSV